MRRRFTFLFWHQRCGRRWVRVVTPSVYTANAIGQVAWTKLLNEMFNTDPRGPLVGWKLQGGWER